MRAAGASAVSGSFWVEERTGTSPKLESCTQGTAIQSPLAPIGGLVGDEVPGEGQLVVLWVPFWLPSVGS